MREVDYLAGQLLVASPRLVDPNFVRTVVVLLNHDEQGAMGVVINRPSEIPVADHLPEWADSLAPPEVVFRGGPVEQSVAIGLREGFDAGANSTPIRGLGMVDFGEEREDVTEGRVRVFAGYAGWGPGQLEEEIEEESWITVPAFARDVFSPFPDDLWAEVLSRQGGQIALLASMPLDPELN
ncbi:MAG: YqgE/AlgH family protein [bacterium]|nr:YqgE/AlgH family protein [bacterium]MDE0601423.1 YqgE/AlgH family protein [bacterium]